MDEFPKALVIASQEEVFRNNNALYRLVRPLPDKTGVQSTDQLVNVVPFRRVYTFYRKQEVIEFQQLLLARPLVLQPVLHFGRGIGSCGACYNDEPWVIMLNQTHPKILGRLQMGLDLARQAIDKGQSVEIKFCFTDLIQRVYKEHLQQKEQEEANGFSAQMFTYTRFTEWEHADLVIRYHGYEAKLWNKKHRKFHKTFHKEWDFTDIGSHEIQWNQTDKDEFYPFPHCAPVTEEDLRAYLPAWTINEISPLQDIGDDIPKQNYSYAQAGRLYESFRKKKRERPQHSNFPANQLEIAGAASAPPEIDQYSPVAIEHDFSYSGEKQGKNLSRARRAYMDQENSQIDDQHGDDMPPYVNYDEEYYPADSSQYYESNVHYDSSNNQYTNVPVSTQRTNQSFASNREHIDAHVLVQPSPVSSRKSASRNEPSHLPSHHYLNTQALKKQDSERSCGSTNADSGFGDDQRSRGGSYDYNDHTRSRPRDEIYTIQQKNQYTDVGLVNPAFDDGDSHVEALERHKRLVAKMVNEHENGKTKVVKYPGYHNKLADMPVQPEVSCNGAQTSDAIADSFI